MADKTFQKKGHVVFDVIVVEPLEEISEETIRFLTGMSTEVEKTGGKLEILVYDESDSDRKNLEAILSVLKESGFQEKKL